MYLLGEFEEVLEEKNGLSVQSVVRYKVSNTIYWLQTHLEDIKYGVITH